MSVQEFYRLKALITLEQVNTTKWLKKKNLNKQNCDGRVLKTFIVWNGLVMKMRFIFGDD